MEYRASKMASWTVYLRSLSQPNEPLEKFFEHCQTQESDILERLSLKDLVRSVNHSELDDYMKKQK